MNFPRHNGGPSPVRLALIALAACALPMAAETGYEAWLRYARIAESTLRQQYDSVARSVVVVGDSPLLKAAQEEFVRGTTGMLGRPPRLDVGPASGGAVVLGSLPALRAAGLAPAASPQLGAEAYWLKSVATAGHTNLLVAGADDRGVLYGVFALLRRMGVGEPLNQLDQTDTPYASIRFLNHWDNLDGTIERGYGGRSIFWESGHIVEDLGRVRDYGRLLASLGINGCSINNVNADARVITAPWLNQVARVAEAWRPWGVRLVLSLDFASPRKIGGVETFDPLDPKAVEFWQRKIDEVYQTVPDLAGFVLKADSEGRLGPSEYHRTHADAANVIARALKPHGGVLFYRGFVYNHRLDWRDLKLDRAKAAYDNFHTLDGQFEDNVIIQIKNGPIDFQVREPASPLFGALQRTCEAIELQITQEYLGQQRHVCYLAPMWKEVLDFDLEASGRGTLVKALVAGKTFHRPTGGFVGVANVGRDTNWLGHPLAMANLYAFGRLAWNPDLSSEQIVEEWTRLSFGNDPEVVRAISRIEQDSWPAYEHYTGPLGIGTLTDILRSHYGPAVEASERNGWGQWHRSDESGTGMDRTVATGTGFIGQYSTAVAQRYESLSTCPDSLLLFFHHVPYTHRLHSGKTVIQHIYDSHYEGAAEARKFVEEWASLKGRIDEARFERVLARLRYQAGHAIVWRDAINNWFLRTSKIPDEHGRAGHFPQRIEAESMQLSGYGVIDVAPWETASAGKAVAVNSPVHRGTISAPYAGQPGRHAIVVQYFDESDGASRYRLFVAGKQIAAWTADDRLPSARPDGHTSTRFTAPPVLLKTGDEIRIESEADGGEMAVIDYIEFEP